MPVLFSRGTTAPFLHPVWSGALAFGGGLAVGCTERGPPPTPTVLVTVGIGGGAWDSDKSRFRRHHPSCFGDLVADNEEGGILLNIYAIDLF